MRFNRGENVVGKRRSLHQFSLVLNLFARTQTKRSNSVSVSHSCSLYLHRYALCLWMLWNMLLHMVWYDGVIGRKGHCLRSLTSSLFFMDSLVLSSMHDVILYSIVINLLPARNINSEIEINSHSLERSFIFQDRDKKGFSTFKMSHNLFLKFRYTLKYSSDTRYVFKAYREEVKCHFMMNNKVSTKSVSLFWDHYFVGFACDGCACKFCERCTTMLQHVPGGQKKTLHTVLDVNLVWDNPTPCPLLFASTFSRLFGCELPGRLLSPSPTLVY